MTEADGERSGDREGGHAPHAHPGLKVTCQCSSHYMQFSFGLKVQVQKKCVCQEVSSLTPDSSKWLGSHKRSASLTCAALYVYECIYSKSPPPPHTHIHVCTCVDFCCEVISQTKFECADDAGKALVHQHFHQKTGRTF